LSNVGFTTDKQIKLARRCRLAACHRRVQEFTAFFTRVSGQFPHPVRREGAAFDQHRPRLCARQRAVFA
jgi:hypothetical protein